MKKVYKVISEDEVARLRHRNIEDMSERERGDLAITDFLDLIGLGEIEILSIEPTATPGEFYAAVDYGDQIGAVALLPFKNDRGLTAYRAVVQAPRSISRSIPYEILRLLFSANGRYHRSPAHMA